MNIENFTQFETFLVSRIPKKEAVFSDEIGIKRAKYFLRLLGNPQNKIKAVHIAGTSGKGSTAHLVSKLLESQGFRVGLSVSPHMFDIRERMQVFRSAIASRTGTTNAGHANNLPRKKLVLKYFNQILPAILKMEKCKFGLPTFFEINVGLAYYMFQKEKLDYAIMETGLGGRLDATNCVENKNKIAILTKIGLDHMEFLGNTVSKIAGEKCGIINRQNTAISIQQTPAVYNVIKNKCLKEKAKLYCIKERNNYFNVLANPQKTIFDFKFSNILIKKIDLSLVGLHQAGNCSLALACLVLLSERDKFGINENSLRIALKNVSICGRMEVKKIKNKSVIIDGAHNEQKMDVFMKNLSHIYPKQKFTFLIAFKKGKDYQTMLKKIIPKAFKIFLTNFHAKNSDNHWGSIDTKTLAEFLKTQHFHKFEIISNKKSAIQKAIFSAKKSAVITGSLYLIGSIYKFLK